MALRLRRGTEAERITITPQAGELIYVLDTKKVYVGDGLTPGGNPIDTNVGALSIDDLTDVNTSGAVSPVDGEALVWDAGAGEWQPKPVLTLETDPTVNGDLKINIVGSDSTLLVDSDNNIITGIFRGDLTGDVYGSLYADDSTIIIDTLNLEVSGTFVGDIRTSDTIRFATDTTDRIFDLRSVTNGNPGPAMTFNSSRGTLLSPTVVDQGDSCVDLQGSGWDGNSYTVASYIKLAVDNNVSVSDGIIPGRIVLGTFDASGNTGLNNVAIWSHTGRLGLSVIEPSEKLDVDGNGKFNGNVIANSLIGDLQGSVFADDSNVLVDAVNGTIPGYVSIAELKSITASSADFNAFKTAIANL